MEQENTENEPHTGGEKLYPLDWETTDVKLAKGRFVHTLARPSNELLLEREDELETEITIAKDGSYSLPDSAAQEAIDAKYHEKVCENSTGYGDRQIPQTHRAAAFQGLFQSEIEADEDADIFDDEIKIVEEIGGSDDPDFTVIHTLRMPDEKELGKIRKIFRAGRIAPEKRGRQKLITPSNLRKAMFYYSQYITRIDGASVGGEKLRDGNLAVFVAHVNPLVQRGVVKAMVEKLTGDLLD